MGNSQSSRASTKTKAPATNRSSESARGRKSTPGDADTATTQGLSNVEVRHPLVSTSDDADTESDYEEEESDEEIDAGMEERRLILQDAKMLKHYATFYLHPEHTVIVTDPFAKGRNYFNRLSAPEQLSVEECEERARILEDVQQFKMYAAFHLHPEKPVITTDSTACARNYFTRASAPEQQTFEETRERAKILEEAALLKKYAEFYLHPEKPVESNVDPTAFGRNYFMRASAPDQMSAEESEERAQILEEAAMLKKYAEFYLHPERPVESTDATACGRNYFTRASAPEYYDKEEAEERDRILAEAAMLKQYATFYLHPEKPVEVTDATACARNYFTRASADEYFDEDESEAEEREKILEEAKMLKMYAGFYLHPERPIKSTADPTAFGRNYFMRDSAPDQMSVEECEERAQILEEAAMLKKFAGFHLHPERPVDSTDATACGRNYFTRASAPEYYDKEEAEERDRILAEAAMLKQYAIFYLHPEKPVETTDATACARNFFARASAPASDYLITSEGKSLSVHEDCSLHDDSDYIDHHFEFDEDLTDFDDFRKSLVKVISERLHESDYFLPLRDDTEDVYGEENEGKLSRSPSSIMLFGYEGNKAF